MKNKNPEMHKQSGQSTLLNRRPVQRESVISLIICVLLSFAIWCYVMSIDSPTYEETFSSVAVTVENNSTSGTDNGFTAISGEGSLVEVSLNGRRAILSALTDEDISAYVDISDAKEAGKHTYPVKIDAPAGTQITDYSPKEITVFVDRKGSKLVDVEVLLRDYTMSSDLYIGEKKPSYDSITVTGPQSELDRIATARLPLRPGNISGSFSSSGDLVLVDTDGNVIDSKYLTMSTTNITCDISVCTTKTVHLTTEFKNNYLNSNTATVTVTPSTVSVKGPVETLKTLSEIVVATLDETVIQEKKTYNYTPEMPSGVEFADALDNVQVSLVLKNCYTTTVAVTDITVKNAPADKTVTVPEQTIRVTVRGSSSAVSNLTADNLTLTVDLSKIDSLSGGRQSVDATAALKGGDSAAAYVMSSYQVEIDVR